MEFRSPTGPPSATFSGLIENQVKDFANSVTWTLVYPLTRRLDPDLPLIVLRTGSPQLTGVEESSSTRSSCRFFQLREQGNSQFRQKQKGNSKSQLSPKVFSVFSFGSITSRVRLSEGIGSGGGDGRRGVSTPCFFSFSKARRELWKREWKSWVSLPLRQTRHWLNSFVPGYLLLDLPLWPVIHESHCR